MFEFMNDITVKATADFTVVNPFRSDDPNRYYDWGVVIGTGHTLTIDTNGHTVDWGSAFAVVVAAGNEFTDGKNGHLVKTGAGTLVLDNRSDVQVEYNGPLVYEKKYGNLTVNAGTVRVMADNQLGQGDVTVASGATLKVEDGVSVARPVKGAGAVKLGYGSKIVCSGATWTATNIEFPSSGNVEVLLADGTSLPLQLISSNDDNVLTEIAGHLDFGENAFEVANGALSVVTPTGTGWYIWNGGANGEYGVPGNWTVDGCHCRAGGERYRRVPQRGRRDGGRERRMQCAIAAVRGRGRRHRGRHRFAECRIDSVDIFRDTGHPLPGCLLRGV